jgi:hypothetical protein
VRDVACARGSDSVPRRRSSCLQRTINPFHLLFSRAYAYKCVQSVGEMNERHGAYSNAQIRAKARSHRRRFLRQIGLRAGELDAIAAGYLDGWARSIARVDLFDMSGDVHQVHEYYAALNSARLWLAKLEQRLALVGKDRGRTKTPVEAYREGQRA